MACVPSILIRFDIESLAPKVLLDVANEAEETRIVDWIRSRDELAQLVQRALELAEEARAA